MSVALNDKVLRNKVLRIVSVRVSKAIRKLRISLNYCVGSICGHSIRNGATKPDWPPVFILGPPRSGSTLLMQVISDAFYVGYITNVHCRWFGAPALADRLLKPLKRKKPSSYRSDHGRTESASDPAECGYWWYRFFRRDPAYVRCRDVSPRKMAAFQRSVVNLEWAIGLPMIFKNLYASVRIEPITQYVPNALFVVIEREWVDNGQSILEGRYDTLNEYGRWWSVPPPDVERLSGLRPVEQVVGQIESIHNLIDRDIDRLGLEERVFRVRYEDFCADVHGTLNAFGAFMKKHGVELNRRFNVPAVFPKTRSRKIPGAMYAELKSEVAKRRRDQVSARSAG